ncbi:filamentous hemagglutinin N-terminal domain-containing protein [Trinickia sp. Y13]|uniref:two-partner secretion domain-containing protein n=1 Tax=Trinickia sp. Y13 TaxID=2917807 RepID=UPI00240626CA|nr:filamentous hemagglutinin N-terminal domain-containing protein [Trinickia sp. Y13]MDG0026762.1 filamentous hemagglutinin N-terminal domain-containing protein [Trinickia sp. Y13]
MTIPMRAIALATTVFVIAQSSAFGAGALPGGGRFVAGTGTIGGDAGSLTIHQTSSKGVIDWGGFSIGAGNRVAFDNGSGATLNRVTGGDTSFILGKLSATGSLYLINPQGVVVGAGGVVSTGGRFVASTLDVDTAAFMSGGPLTFDGASTRRVVNLGKIGSSGGDVFLISSDEVDNFGCIEARQGSVELAAGHTVLLQDASSGQQVFVKTGSRGTIVNRGAIEAAQVSLQAADGNIYALSGNHAAIRATGTASRDGHVWLVADTGGLTLAQPVEAHDADGKGGTVDTRAAGFAFVGDTPAVLAGLWKVTTPRIAIDASAARFFSRSLSAGTSVNLQTTGALGRDGDIEVAGNIDWHGNASLTLGAYRSLTIGNGAAIRNAGGGSSTLRADATAIDDGGSVINNGTLDWSKSTGIVSLLYDMNGNYRPGAVLGNPAWTSPQLSSLPTQITGYELINSLDDLALLQTPNANYGGNYALGRDLESDYRGMPSGTLVGIGNDTYGTTHTFTGQFDGMGHTLDAAWVSAGFFDQIGAGAFVRNFKITNSYALPGYGDYIEASAVGLLARDNQGVVANVYVQGSVGGYAVTGGGLVGSNEGTIMRAGADVGVSSDGINGGLVGHNSGTIVQSFATGDVGGVAFGVTPAVSGGGLVAVNDGTIAQSYATGNAAGDPFTIVAAGLAAYNNGTITQSFATGQVSGQSPIQHQGPQLAGITNGNTVGASGGAVGSDVYWDAQTSGQSYGGPGVPDANGLTTAQMSNPASFVGWNFGPGGVWAMPADATHPVLAWQLNGQLNGQ